MRVCFLLVLIPVANTCVHNHNALTCSELGWDPLSFGNSDVCGGSICSSEPVSWNNAKKNCENIGARLCSIFELHRGEAYNSGCSLNKLPVWSSTSCINSTLTARVIISYPFPSEITCVSKELMTGYIRCCSDVTKCPSPLPTFLPTNITTSSSKNEHSNMIKEEALYTIISWLFPSITLVIMFYFIGKKSMRTLDEYPKPNYYCKYFPGLDVVLNSIIHTIIRNLTPTHSQNKKNDEEHQQKTRVDEEENLPVAIVNPNANKPTQQLANTRSWVSLSCYSNPIGHIITAVYMRTMTMLLAFVHISLFQKRAIKR